MDLYVITAKGNAERVQQDKTNYPFITTELG